MAVRPIVCERAPQCTRSGKTDVTFDLKDFSRTCGPMQLRKKSTRFLRAGTCAASWVSNPSDTPPAPQEKTCNVDGRRRCIRTPDERHTPD